MIERKKSIGSLRLVNVARISPEKNLLFALELLQKVKENVELDIYGPIYNEAYWEECKTVMAILPHNIKVNYKGSLESEKVTTEIINYDFMFMPTRGENFGHIILQSLSVGCPVIISDQTPWKKLIDKNVGWDIPLDRQDLFIQTIENCAEMKQEEYNEMTVAAFDFAKKYIDNPEIVEQNRHLFI
ncbi:MAG: glycosyltransferase [Bacteroidetes bacterium]|nr:glycosyltransferase [Bacteroidota bacterium]